MRFVFISSLVFTLLLGMSFQKSLHAKDEDRGSYSPRSKREGFYTALTTGQLYFTGNDRRLYHDAWVVGIKAGYDILQYLGAEAQMRFSGHDSTLTTASATVPTGFNVFQLLIGAKGGYPVLKRLKLSLSGGGGFFYTTPNLQKTTNATRALGYASFEMEYAMRIKGMSMGLDPSISLVKDLKSVIIQATGFVRYTF